MRAEPNRDLMMHDRLVGVIRHLDVENGTHNLELDFGSLTDAWPWVVTVTSWEDTSTYEEESGGHDRGLLVHDKFRGATLAEAVERAWLHYRSPMICRSCAGDGAFFRRFESGVIFEQHPDETLTVHHDGSASLRRDCEDCRTEGLTMVTR